MSFLSKLFNDESDEFNEVCVDREVLESVIYYSKKSYPNEFLAFFDGKIEDKTLYLTGLIFIPGETGNTGAVIHTEMLPPTLKYWGSVHSHPGPSARPSGPDLMTFSKHGVFHMIVCLPYSLETFMAYDKYGNVAKYTIGDYSDMVDYEVDDFFDESDVLLEGEVIKPGFFDEDIEEVDDTPKVTYEDFENQNKIILDGAVTIEFDQNGNIKRIYKK